METNEIFEKNMSVLNVHDYDKTVEQIRETEITHVSYDDGVLVYSDENGKMYLTSRYDKEGYAKTFANQYKDVKHFANIFVFGFGDGTYIRELLKLDVTYVIVFEPSLEIFKEVISKVDVSDILSERRFCLIFSSRDELIYEEYLKVAVTLPNMNLNVFTHLPNYQMLFLEKWKRVTRLYINIVERVAFDRNTEYALAREIHENTLELLPDIVNQYSASDLIDEINGKLDKKDAVILVAAGPSLDKNADLLKDVKGKIPIVAVDTALKTLVRKGIIPDLTITVDPHKPLVLFDDKRIETIPMVVYTCSNKSVIKVHKGKRFYFVMDFPYMKKIYEEYDKPVYANTTGGSVACNAFSMLLSFGFSNIILMGQDLAYPDKKGHASDAYDGKEKAVDEKESKYFYVDSIDGGKVLTEPNMDMYRKWFENQISIYSDDVDIYDATEGGALIHGSIVTTLKDVLSKFQNEDFDLTKIIEGMKPAFDKKQKKEIEEKIFNMPKDLEERECKIKDGIKAYRKLEKMYLKKKTTGKEFRDAMEIVSTTNDFVDHDGLCELVSSYNVLESIDLSQSIYDYDSSSTQYSQLKEVVDKGIDIFESYLRSIDKFELDYEKIKENFEKYEVLVDRSEE